MADAISTSNTWPNYSTGNVTKAASTSKTELGKDQFLTILVAQLKNQDPMSPMDNTEFVSQMAQFSSLEQLISIGEKIDGVGKSVDTSLGASSQLIGKKITWPEESTDSTSGSTSTTYKSGTVESIVLKNGVQYAQVGEDAVPLSIIAMVEPVSTTATTTSTATAATTTDATTSTEATTTPTTTDTTTSTGTTTDATTSTSDGNTTSTETTPTTTTDTTTSTADTDTTANESASTTESATDTTATGSEEGSS